jgi:RimJ/RimL family protein N-acetyltransferase
MCVTRDLLLTPLFLKPLCYPGEILYSRYVSRLNGNISFRSFNLEKDLDSIFRWVNLDYALRYWQLDGSRQRVYDTYYNIQRNSNAHSYIGLLDDTLVCQFDVYRILADEVQQFVPAAGKDDCGFHLLMAPNEKPVRGLTSMLIRTMLEYYFSFPDAMRMYAEPDINNANSNRLLRQAGFSFIQSVDMSYKKANLFWLTREQFEKNPVH